MLSEKLKTWEYYKNKIPLYLQNSYGFQEQFEIIYEILKTIDLQEDEILYAFNILDSNYSNWLETIGDGNQMKILDMIGSYFGVVRVFDVTYQNNGETINKKLHLTDKEFLNLIKARIIQNNYKGTYEDSRKFYDRMNLPVYLFNSNEPAEVNILLDDSNQLSENEKSMFLANLFTLKSIGITYNCMIVNINNLLIWNSNNEHNMWDSGVWNV